jgi:hypothetical protein
VDGRLNVSLEWATGLFRLANFSICTQPDPKPPDIRQGSPDLRGESWKPRLVSITIS